MGLNSDFSSRKVEIVGFEHLHLHTDFSLLDGFGLVEEYAQRAPQINQKFLTVSDHGMLAVVPRQIRACEKINEKKGKDTISPIFSVELYINRLQPESNGLEDVQKFIVDLNEDEKNEIKASPHLLAIAYNDIGYKNLVRLTSWGWTKGFYRKPRINYDQLLKHKEGLIFTSCCYNSEVGRAFDRQGEDAAFAVIERYVEMVGKDHYYLELMLLDFKKQKPYDAFIIKAHEKYGLPLILSNDCLVPGTLVLTNKGNKKIEELKVGDSVLTHKNRFKKVEYLNVRDVEQAEGVYSIKAAMGTLAWNLTGNHQVRVASVKSKQNKKVLDKLDWKRADELTKDDYLVAPKISPDSIFSSKNLAYIDLTKILGPSDYRIDDGKVGTGSARKLVFNNNCFLSYHRFDKKNAIKIPASLKVTKDFLRVLGLYIAEGGLDGHSQVSFGLHVLEKDEELLLRRYFGQFGMNLTKSCHGNGKKIFFSSVVFHKLFESLCGKGSSNKQLPKIDGTFFGNFSRKQVLIIVKQYLLGDGHCPARNDRAAMVLSTSKCLIYDLSCIFNSLGIFTIPCCRSYEKAKHKNKNANPKNWKDAYYISFGGRSRIKFSNLFGFNFTKVASDSKRGKRYIELDNSYLVKVFSVKKLKYTGKVFNIQVQEDESYTADLLQVHNCHYCNKEDSKFQRLMLMVQTKRTVQEIQAAIAADDTQDFFELQDASLWMKSEEELNEKWLNEYSDVIPYELFCEAKRNTVRICEKAKGVQLDRSLKLPVLPDADEILKEEVMNGFKRRNLPKTKEYLDRIKEEYSLITRKGFASYFLIQKKMTDEARRSCKEILGWGDGSQACGPGRGSAAGALICYCLSITNVDPVKEGLLFSRFMSEARGGRSISLEFKNLDPLPVEEVFNGN